MPVHRTLFGILLVTSGALPSAADAAPQCQGLPASIVCGGGACNGTPMDDVIFGTNGADDIHARGGNDVVCGGGADDVISGGSGDDVIYGNRGDDIIEGNRGDDVIYGNRGDDLIEGNGGADHIRGNHGDDVISGGGGPDNLNGNRGNDRLDGRQGDDIVRGGGENDVLIGGPGTDVCDGGGGNDDHGLPFGTDTCETEQSLEGSLTLPQAVTSVSPSSTDPEIDDPLDGDYPVGGDHLVYVNPTVPQREEILVHLPGTFGTPAGSSAFLEAVADQGMKAIGLQYVNNGTVNGACFNDWNNNPPPDRDCQEGLRLERIYGTNTSTLADVNPANSLVNRLVKLLEYLDIVQPEVGWDDYLDAGAPRWERIVISGFSQGSGMAALIARDETVARALMFGGPSDFDPLGNSAAWITDSKATPIGDHYGFRHVDDQQFPVEESWNDMGLPGPPVIVDTTDPPFEGSHFLETDVDVPPGHEHRSVIDSTLIGLGGSPLFLDVWTYMCCSP